MFDFRAEQDTGIFVGFRRGLWPVEGRGCRALNRGVSSLVEICRSLGYQWNEEASSDCVIQDTGKQKASVMRRWGTVCTNWANNVRQLGKSFLGVRQRRPWSCESCGLWRIYSTVPSLCKCSKNNLQVNGQRCAAIGFYSQNQVIRGRKDKTIFG